MIIITLFHHRDITDNQIFYIHPQNSYVYKVCRQSKRVLQLLFHTVKRGGRKWHWWWPLTTALPLTSKLSTWFQLILNLPVWDSGSRKCLLPLHTEGKFEGRHPDRRTDRETTGSPALWSWNNRHLLTGMLRCSDTTKRALTRRDARTNVQLGQTARYAFKNTYSIKSR